MPALRWIAQEELVYDVAANTLHRADCPRRNTAGLERQLSAGSALELVWAPRMCECGPNVTLAL